MLARLRPPPARPTAAHCAKRHPLRTFRSSCLTRRFWQKIYLQLPSITNPFRADLLPDPVTQQRPLGCNLHRHRRPQRVAPCRVCLCRTQQPRQPPPLRRLLAARPAEQACPHKRPAQFASINMFRMHSELNSHASRRRWSVRSSPGPQNRRTARTACTCELNHPG